MPRLRDTTSTIIRTSLIALKKICLQKKKQKFWKSFCVLNHLKGIKFFSMQEHFIVADDFFFILLPENKPCIQFYLS